MNKDTATAAAATIWLHSETGYTMQYPSKKFQFICSTSRTNAIVEFFSTFYSPGDPHLYYEVNRVKHLTERTKIAWKKLQKLKYKTVKISIMEEEYYMAIRPDKTLRTEHGWVIKGPGPVGFYTGWAPTRKEAIAQHVEKCLFDRPPCPLTEHSSNTQSRLTTAGKRVWNRYKKRGDRAVKVVIIELKKERI